MRQRRAFTEAEISEIKKCIINGKVSTSAIYALAKETGRSAKSIEQKAHRMKNHSAKTKLGRAIVNNAETISPMAEITQGRISIPFKSLSIENNCLIINY